jgi:hypothetical protein
MTLLRDAALALLASRAILGTVAWLVSGLPRSREWSGVFAARGWQYTPVRPLDLWAKWDSGWFLDIVLRGYDATPLAAGQQSNIAFFPLYPVTVRLLHGLLPQERQGLGAAVAVGVAVSTACAAGALAVLARHVSERTRDPGAGSRAMLSLLAFPTAFFLTCVYTEAPFLLLAVSAWHLAWKRSWAAAGAAGLLLALARPNGAAMILPLGWLYLESIGFRWRRIRPDALWLLLVPAGFVAWSAWLTSVTGDPLAAPHAQLAWGRVLSSPLALLRDARAYGPVKLLDQALVIGATAASFLALRRGWRGEAVLVLTLIATFAFTGTALSASRFLLVAFPLHAWSAALLRGDRFRIAVACGIAVQSALFAAWSLGGWAG